MSFSSVIATSSIDGPLSTTSKTAEHQELALPCVLVNPQVVSINMGPGSVHMKDAADDTESDYQDEEYDDSWNSNSEEADLGVAEEAEERVKDSGLGWRIIDSSQLKKVQVCHRLYPGHAQMHNSSNTAVLRCITHPTCLSHMVSAL